MKARKKTSPGSTEKINRMQRQMAAARTQAEKLRSAARKAKAELKRVRKSFKLAKRAAKLARKKIKAWKRMLQAAQQVVSAAKSKSRSAAPQDKAPVQRTARRTKRAPSKRSLSVAPEITSASLSLGEQYSSGATLGTAAKLSSAGTGADEFTGEVAPPISPSGS